VVGVRSGGARERARLVIGADGRHSRVAKAVGALAYHVEPARSVAYYAYWSGVPLAGGEMYGRERRMVGAWPTNDGLVVTYVCAPADEFGAFRADPEGALLRSLDLCGDLGERVRAGDRAGRVYGTADLENRFHVPYGPGWALVGDAGLRMDPVTGQGIAHAFRDAELVAAAAAGEISFAEYQAQRDAASLPMYEVTLDLAACAPPRLEQQLVYEALARRPEEIPRFLGAICGALPLSEFFGPRNLLRLLGPRRMLKAGRARRKMAA
jgi:2-polyprenyl-6-methoxyphenol hydroxylase-like FAD-dependent oxidoreductase